MERTEFEAWLARDGFDGREVSLAPDEVRDIHTHPFDARLLILDGVFILQRTDGADTFRVGEICEVPAGTPHAELGGPQGARYLAGRRTPPAPAAA